MLNVIQLLPDNIANQIAAGEVVQSPAHIVKELVENAIDAGATKVIVLVEDGGIRSVQVIDNGKGMSVIDARMCFERHATSKIKSIDDIYAIRTMGFRGEALASIAAVASVTLKTKLEAEQVGTMVEIGNAVVQKQEPYMCNNGTDIVVKNLFFTVPARKHFLKSEKKELEQIVNEFLRIAIPFYHLDFQLIHNTKTIYNLSKTNLKNRILQIYKTYYADADFIPVQQEYNDITFKGFVGKPQSARTSRGHQYFFVNQRFIKNNYLGHAVNSAFASLIDKEHHPSYFIFIDINTRQIDVNVHPTKQEIKFQDEKIVYAFLQACLRKSLSQYALAPSINFESAKIERLYDSLNTPSNNATTEKTQSSELYQGFTKKNQAHFIPSENSDWKKFYETQNPQQHGTEKIDTPLLFSLPKLKNEDWLHKNYIQLKQEYIVTTIQNSLLIVHQQLAHQIILYERYAIRKETTKIFSEPLLFPFEFSLSPEDALILTDLLADINKLGYQINPTTENAFILLATPNDFVITNFQTDIEKIIETYQYIRPLTNIDKKEKLIRCMALKNSLKAGKLLSQTEMQQLMFDLFQTTNPQYTYGNMRSFILLEEPTIQNLF